MEMMSTRDYLLHIRGMVGRETVIIVPNTESYAQILSEIKDPNTRLKGDVKA